MRMSRRLALYAAGGAFTEGSFTYTGTYEFADQGNDNWMVRFLTTGVLTLKKKISVDVWLLGGGGGGDLNGGGGGSGYCGTVAQNITLNRGQSVTITIGAGGTGGKASDANENSYQYSGKTGGTTSFAIADGSTYSKAGGKGSGNTRAQYSNRVGGDGASGGGGYDNGEGGTNGSNGKSGSRASGGKGQGPSTYEFGDSSLVLRAKGGGAQNSTDVKDKNANTGDGGKGRGGTTTTAYSGASGIAIIRNARG